MTDVPEVRTSRSWASEWLEGGPAGGRAGGANEDRVWFGSTRVYCGKVLHGARLGRTIGFPTANIALAGMRPQIGIYAARVRLEDGRLRQGVGYYGDRPTVEGEGELLEVFLFDFNEEIYGQMLWVELVAFIRPDVTFDSLDAMTRQIGIDCAAAAAVLAHA